jgi:hypothetical protein
VAARGTARSWAGCNTRCRGLYLHLWPRPMGRTQAPLASPARRQPLVVRRDRRGAKELALEPAGLAHHRTKNQVAPVTKLDPRTTSNSILFLFLFPPSIFLIVFLAFRHKGSAKTRGGGGGGSNKNKPICHLWSLGSSQKMWGFFPPFSVFFPPSVLGWIDP